MIYDIPTLTSEAIGLLKSLIAIPSLSRDEEKAADYLQNYIEMQGMATGRKGNNVWCLSPMFDLKKPTLLLNSHIDTVKPVNGWRKDPFKPTLESNGKLYGLGSNDGGAAWSSCPASPLRSSGTPRVWAATIPVTLRQTVKNGSVGFGTKGGTSFQDLCNHLCFFGLVAYACFCRSSSRPGSRQRFWKRTPCR